MNKKVVIGMVVLVVLECLFVPTNPKVVHYGDEWRRESGWEFIGNVTSSEINPTLFFTEVGLTLILGLVLAIALRNPTPDQPTPSVSDGQH